MVRVSENSISYCKSIRCQHQDLKIAKFKMLSFKKNVMFNKLSFFIRIILGANLLHENIRCVYIMYTKYQTPTAKISGTSSIHYVCTICIPKILRRKESEKDAAILSKLFLGISWYQACSCKCSVCLHCVNKAWE